MYTLAVERFLHDRLDRRRMGRRPPYTIVDVLLHRGSRSATFDSIVFLQGSDALLVSLYVYGDWYLLSGSPASLRPR